ncbi:MAG: hypothetical protein U9O90_09925, partial [Euryarchaeota archaeon]|nr:hypothetical protein [Euryarchaeota archaeon]
QKELFIDLKDIRKKSKIFFETENKFNAWKLRNEDLKSVDPKRRIYCQKILQSMRTAYPWSQEESILSGKLIPGVRLAYAMSISM